MLIQRQIAPSVVFMLAYVPSHPMLASQAPCTPCPYMYVPSHIADLNMNTRVSWKYATTRGVSGTPTFFVNDINVPADSTWTLQEWTALIDPLLAPSTSSKNAVDGGARLSGYSAAHITARGTVGRS